MPSTELKQHGIERGGLEILLVEDNEDDAFLLERHLQRNGFSARIRRIETAPELQQALEDAQLPSLILADYNLPNFSGPEALLILKSSGLDIPFIMLSGVMTETTAVESMRAGAKDYVTKQNLVRLVPAVERELREAEDRRKKLAAERALQASEDRFHRLVEAMPLGLLISDAAGLVVYTNASARNLFHLENSEPYGIRLEALCPNVPTESFFRTAGPLQETFETTCHIRNGTTLDALIGVALLNPGSPPNKLQLATFVADLTLQKKGERLLRRTEKLAVAGRLAASIAHEINNPLEAVTNLLYLIGQADLQEEVRAYLKQAVKQLDRVALITVQTLRFHRRSSKPVETDLRELVETVLPLFESRARMLHSTVESRYRAIPTVMAHDGEVRQVIANLISNATDALGEGGRLLLRLAPSSNPKTGVAGVVLTVADTGSGIAPDVLERIFEPFFSTKGDTGTGLGLWVSLEIVEKHQGTLRVKSRTADHGKVRGTMFRFFLPTEGPVANHKIAAEQ